VKFPCSFFLAYPNFIPEKWEKSWKTRQGCIEASLQTLPTNPIQNAIFNNFLLSISYLSYQLYYHEKILLTTKIKSGILVIEQKIMFPSWSGNQKNTNQPGKKRTRFPKKQQQIDVLCGTAYKPFLLYVKFTNWTKKRQKIKNKKKVIIPILVLKQKTKHTHLKRCLYYNHLPQSLEICSPQKWLQKRSPLEALTESKNNPGTRSQCWWLWQVLPTPWQRRY